MASANQPKILAPEDSEIEHLEESPSRDQVFALYTEMMMLGQQIVSHFQAQLQRMRRSEKCQI
jgi:hypothetical protein